MEWGEEWGVVAREGWIKDTLHTVHRVKGWPRRVVAGTAFFHGSLRSLCIYIYIYLYMKRDSERWEEVSSIRLHSALLPLLLFSSSLTLTTPLQKVTFYSLPKCRKHLLKLHKLLHLDGKCIFILDYNTWRHSSILAMICSLSLCLEKMCRVRKIAEGNIGLINR